MGYTNCKTVQEHTHEPYKKAFVWTPATQTNLCPEEE